MEMFVINIYLYIYIYIYIKQKEWEISQFFALKIFPTGDVCHKYIFFSEIVMVMITIFTCV